MKRFVCLTVACLAIILMSKELAEASSVKSVARSHTTHGNVKACATLFGVIAVASNNIWAVGGTCQNGHTRIQHWDGTQWSIVPSPDPGVYGNKLYSIAALSANDIWAVGWSHSSIFQTLIEHWDGTQWSVITSPNGGGDTNVLQSVAVISSTDVWTVGWDGNQNNPQTLTEHWDGTNWQIVPSPSLGLSNNELYGVAAVSANDIWAVGTLIEHWDGTQWSVVPSPNAGILNAVTAIASNDIWAVGTGILGTLAEHWDGTQWSIVSSPNMPQSSNGFMGVAAAGPDDIWAVGSYQYTNKLFTQTLIEHWDGTQWGIISSPNIRRSNNVLHGVVAIANTNAWAVGSSSPNRNTQHIMIEHWDGTKWSIIPSP